MIEWRKSSCSGKTNCVEVAFGQQAVAVRDSKRPGPMLTVPASAWQAFLVTKLR